MSEKSALLRELRIDRSEVARRPRRAPILSVIVMVLGLAGVAVWIVSEESPAVADARPAAPAAPSAAQSALPGNGMQAVLEASGYVVARRQATVSSKVTGRVAQVLVDEGEYVAANQIIARLDNSNTNAALQLAQANVMAASAAYDDAKPIFERSQRLFSAGASSAQAVDQVRAAYDIARTNLVVAQRALSSAQQTEDDMVIRAPFAGVITDRAANEGEIVSPISAGGGFTRTGICTIVDMQTLEVEVDVGESLIGRVQPGQPATVELSAYPGRQIAATVVGVVPTADRAKGTVKVRIKFDHADPKILPEMSAHVVFREMPRGASSGSSSNVAAR